MGSRLSQILAWALSFELVQNFTLKFKLEQVYFKFLMNYSIQFKDKRSIKKYFENSKVISGVFNNLLIPKYKVISSAYYPKLLGSYEIEIQSHLLTLLYNNSNTYFIDFGCADGYYLAIAKKIRKDIFVIGVDIDSKALKLSTKILKINQLFDNKILFSKEFESRSVEKYNQGIMVVDCEGFEAKLFENLEISFIQKTNFIIEIHDFIDKSIFDRVSKKLSLTHTIEVVYSNHLETKLKYIPKELSYLNIQSKYDLISESRPEKMRWIIAQIKI